MCSKSAFCNGIDDILETWLILVRAFKLTRTFRNRRAAANLFRGNGLKISSTTISASFQAFWNRLAIHSCLGGEDNLSLFFFHHPILPPLSSSPFPLNHHPANLLGVNLRLFCRSPVQFCKPISFALLMLSLSLLQAHGIFLPVLFLPALS